MGARPLPLPLWDRRAGKLVYEFMDDAPSTYESQPRRSLNQWLESHPLYDWILAAYQNSRLSARKVVPFIRKHQINMDEFEPVAYRSLRNGGSAIAVFGQAGRWRPSADVLKNTVNGIETMLRLGEEVARSS